MNRPPLEVREYLTPGEAAQALRIAKITLRRWDVAGRFAPFGPGAVIRTLGGDRRFAADVIARIARGEQP